ncbi:replication terminator protein [Alicyclobacillus sp. SO9]|uniref:replication terminator protein n=1 Tax=Alicyclobacillus sp. SO9 TaxID=2665646 RepID=UPI0018E8241D|nr:replication terminator protein [Alicyclobacillus sp. SO9]QQE80897.1 replication terminator protein [Alicyclobacillus sp. SO9]
MSINLSKLAGGAVQERFEQEFQRIIENIADPNTDAKKKRKLQLTLTFEPNEDRSISELSIESKITTAPPMGVSTSLLIGADSDGVIASREIMQTRLFEDEESEPTDGQQHPKVSYIEWKQGGQA